MGDLKSEPIINESAESSTQQEQLSAQKDDQPQVVSVNAIDHPSEENQSHEQKESRDDSTQQPNQRIECNSPPTEEDKKLKQIRSAKILSFTQKDTDLPSKLQKYLGLPVFDEVYERQNRKSYHGEFSSYS